ncbi:hypothetical protein H8S37_04735 [Mediterraneibacter sp. NSJ-55]|uniref:Uncharacterized protein n=1 Tax=Mediterraneibacter hominis TaxID=2763054 RepID=A0A923LH84_9FIRM|nr:hypothetical protein [Mediterraneibacter hominis]MBC5688235.1 hypothetical protein [Mediterraneibacter hominis]
MSIVIKNQIQIPSVSVMPGFGSKINLSSNTTVTARECKLFEIALHMVCKLYQHEKRNLSEFPKMNILFTYDFTFEFQNNSATNLGLYMNLIIYSMQNIRNNIITELNYLAIYIEELCHCVWHIDDELIVKNKVIEVFKLSGLNVTEELFYLKGGKVE